MRLPGDGFGTCFHIIGGQTIPNYIGVKLLPAKRHVLVATEQSRRAAEALCSTLGDSTSTETLIVDAYDYRNAFNGILKRARDCEDVGIAFNVTGGTKVMSTAATDVCREVGGRAFYVDTAKKKLREIPVAGGTGGEMDMPPVFKKVGELLGLAGVSVSRKGITKEEWDKNSDRRKDLVRKFWEWRRATRVATVGFCEALNGESPEALEKLEESIGWLMGRLEESEEFEAKKRVEEIWNSRKRKRSFEEMFSKARSRLEEELNGVGCGETGQILEEWEKEFKSRKEMAKFARGEWFEEWLFMKLAESGDESVRDLRLNVVLLPPGNERGGNNDRELDLVFTDGYSLVIIEAKAGIMERSHLDKLSMIISSKGGLFGKALLAAIDPWKCEWDGDERMAERIEQRRGWVKQSGVAVVSREALEGLAENIGRVGKGNVYIEKFSAGGAEKEGGGGL